MYTGFGELYKYRTVYCRFKIMYDDCKWWQFIRKKAIKEQINWVYPLMRNEVGLTPIT
jgi:hypothetical protein